MLYFHKSPSSYKKLEDFVDNPEEIMITDVSGYIKELSLQIFNKVVKCDNLRYWRISKATWEKDKVELHIIFEKDGIQSILDKNFDTIMEAVEYFYNFLKTL